MRFLKKYSFMIITVCAVAAIIFIPGMLMKFGDREDFGHVHVEAVSPGRNALLVTMTLEERIGMCCDYSMNSALLFDNVMVDSYMSGQKENENQVMVEYAYSIEEERVFEKYREELEKLTELEILPKYVIEQKKTSALTGQRMYLYSKKEDKGAVFVRLELYFKTGLGARFMIDEESGKVIGFFMEGDLVGKEQDLQINMGEKFLSYLGLPYEYVKIGKKEQCFSMKEEEYYYQIFHIGNEMGVCPFK